MSFNFLGVRCLDLVGGPRDAREPQGGQAQETVQYRLRKLRPGGREHSGEAHTGVLCHITLAGRFQPFTSILFRKLPSLDNFSSSGRISS
jgi:hypothetical protein